MRERITKRVEKIFYKKETHKFITLKDMKSTKCVSITYRKRRTKVRVRGEITESVKVKKYCYVIYSVIGTGKDRNDELMPLGCRVPS